MNKHRASRRSFLKGTAMVAAASGISIARHAHAAGGDTLRIALVGCGGRGTGAAANCLNVQRLIGEKIKLVAVADAFEDRARGSLKNLQRQYADQVEVPDDRVFVGLDAYRKAIDCDIDLVLFGTPPGFRPAQYAYAVEKGRHVFMEKPCCTDAPG